MSIVAKTLGTALLATALTAPASAAQQRVDPKLPTYEPTQGVSGSIKSVGSDTMNNLMTLWAEGFLSHYPSVSVEIEGKGSATAPPALTEGTSNFGPMSRAMKDTEMDEFEKKHGYKATPLETAIDMLAVYVHKDNPVRGLTLAQVDAIFSKNRTGGYAEDVTTWGQLGLTGEWANKRIELYGRNSASGTYGYFKKYGLFKGDFKDSVKEQPGSSSVVSAVAGDPYAIGYSGIGYKTADVRAVPLAKDSGSAFIAATPDKADSYPLARFLYTYVNYEPGTQIDPLRREFMKFIFSREGQAIVLKDGYLPITAPIARRALGKVNIDLPAPVEASAPTR